MERYYLYILRNPSGRNYIGQTKNLSDRLERHNKGHVKTTRNNGPWRLVYSEKYDTRSEAIIRERQLKKWRRSLLDNLIL